MKIIELIIDPEGDVLGVDAISLVNQPAIERNFVTLKNHKMGFKATSEERRVLMGPALIPDKPIYRKDDAMGEYYVYFSKNTVRQASEVYLRRGLQASFTMEHEHKMEGCCVVESWIVEGEKDKSTEYGFSEPVGTWMVSVKVIDENLWQSFVKNGDVLGFSIEGFFSDKMESKKEGLTRTGVKEDSRYKDGKTLMESYSDYPKAVRNNAKKALKWAEKNGWGSCGTAVGKQRANQLANGEPITKETITRMKSYLSRSEKTADVPYSEGCGGLMYDSWGGKAALRWSTSKLKKLNMASAIQEIDDTIIKKLTN